MANLSPTDPYARRRGSAVGIGAPLSLEASLDEENREVLANLGRQRSSEQPARRVSRGESPLPSIRSMLDVDSPPRSRHGSIAGIGVGVTSPLSPRDQRKPSTRLDPSDPSTWTRPHRAASPSPAKSASETSQTGLPKINFDEKEGFEKQYNFDMASMPTSTGTAGRGVQNKNSIYSAATLNNDMSELHVGSKSPKIAVSPPETSIYANSSTGGSAPLTLTPEATHKRSIYAHGPESDAHRRMSNKSSSFSSMSDGPTGRVEKDEEADEDVVMSSDDEEVGESSSEEDEASEDERGRARQKPLTFPKDEVEQKLEEKQNEGMSYLLSFRKLTNLSKTPAHLNLKELDHYLILLRVLLGQLTANLKYILHLVSVDQDLLQQILKMTKKMPIYKKPKLSESIFHLSIILLLIEMFA